MKRILVLLLAAMMLCGCSANTDSMDRAMNLRGKIQQKEVTFDTSLTADYGDKVYTFSMTYRGDTQGNLQFTVTEPESTSYSKRMTATRAL